MDPAKEQLLSLAASSSRLNTRRVEKHVQTESTSFALLLTSSERHLQNDNSSGTATYVQEQEQEAGRGFMETELRTHAGSACPADRALSAFSPTLLSPPHQMRIFGDPGKDTQHAHEKTSTRCFSSSTARHQQGRREREEKREKKDELEESETRMVLVAREDRKDKKAKREVEEDPREAQEEEESAELCQLQRREHLFPFLSRDNVAIATLFSFWILSERFYFRQLFRSRWRRASSFSSSSSHLTKSEDKTTSASTSKDKAPDYLNHNEEVSLETRLELLVGLLFCPVAPDSTRHGRSASWCTHHPFERETSMSYEEEIGFEVFQQAARRVGCLATDEELLAAWEVLAGPSGGRKKDPSDGGSELGVFSRRMSFSDTRRPQDGIPAEGEDRRQGDFGRPREQGGREREERGRGRGGGKGAGGRRIGREEGSAAYNKEEEEGCVSPAREMKRSSSREKTIRPSYLQKARKEAQENEADRRAEEEEEKEREWRRRRRLEQVRQWKVSREQILTRAKVRSQPHIPTNVHPPRRFSGVTYSSLSVKRWRLVDIHGGSACGSFSLRASLRSRQTSRSRCPTPLKEKTTENLVTFSWRRALSSVPTLISRSFSLVSRRLFLSSSLSFT